MQEREKLGQVHRVVVKIGTAVILGPNGQPNGEVLLPLARQIARLRQAGREVVLVSSGAVGLGRAALRNNSESLPMKQALAAIGQVELMNVWKRIFELLCVSVAQVLLTREDLRARERYLNARNTLLTLLESGVLPVVNENDSVATAEIKFGDNDILACLVGALVDAGAVINLTQTRGLLRPLDEQPVELWPTVSRVDDIDAVASLVRQEKTASGTGGMASKLEAARVAVEYGGMMVIARAAEDEVLPRLLAGEDLGTLFVPRRVRLGQRKRWLAAGGAPRGSVRLDEGAVRAVTAQGRSLLPVGVGEILGEFGVGDLISVCDGEGRELGRGLVNYSARDLRLIRGQPTTNIEELLGFRGCDEVIHRDNLFIREATHA